MNYFFWVILVVISFFSYFAIKQDILKRMVSNKITAPFFIFSILIFLFYFENTDILSYFFIILSFFIGYFLYKKDIWGAADGKIFISITFILVSFLSSKSFFDYILNLFIIYALTITIISQIKTSSYAKKLVLKKINYLEILFILSFSFLIFGTMFHFIDFKFSDNIYSLIILLVFISFHYIRKFARKYYSNISKKDKYFVNLALILILFSFNSFSFQSTFLIVLFIKIFI